MREVQHGPFYTGVTTYTHESGAFSLRLPTDWTQFEGASEDTLVFGPHSDRTDTCFIAEMRTLEVKSRASDVKTLRKGLRTGIEALADAEIEWENESITPSILAVEAKYSFLEDGIRRKRWVRVVYSGRTQLILIAQGATVEEFEYWLPMFYNIMTTFQMQPG